MKLGVKRLLKLKSKKWLAIVVLLIIIIAAVTVWSFYNKSTSASAEVQYQQAQVKRGDIVVGFDSDGTINLAKLMLKFNVRGTISEIPVAEGDKVQKGDVLAKLDDRDYQDQYQLALARLNEAREQHSTSLLDNELQIENAKVQLQQQRDAYAEMEAIPEAYPASEIQLKKMELANKEKEFQNMQKKFELLQGKQLRQEELAVKMAREDLEDTILYAPVSGVVLGLSSKVGESVVDDQEFATIHENNSINAVTTVIEYDVAQIKAGQKVYVTVEAIPDKEFAGEVTKINALPTSDSSGLVNYTVEISINEPDPDLKDGMTSMVSFVTREVRNCLIVPYRAVTMVDGKQFVTVLDQDGQVTKQIEAGFTDGSDVEVLSGLDGNETVVYQQSR
ncbi:MAG TPA: efflux RND transporter periplasmic adaptor subunit [Desulfotomaculum sp.]|nr:MAG: RND transporter [Peptococcaceae bacterium BRH_c8a]KJS71324.1 MAG: RND transporter [Desulfotomaculum sp. BICA1-6]HBX23624.1 efflux RND transporter periplasmic adaptor subunit [Desulfotomaculum sp.]